MNLFLYRVISRKGPVYYLSNGALTFSAQVSGALSHETDESIDLPCVGDWVEGTEPMAGDFGIQILITKVTERKNIVKRVSGKGEQAIAANLDTLFVVTSANEEFNPRRIERYLVMAESGMVPLKVVLSKIDLCSDITAIQKIFVERFPKIEVIYWSAQSREGFEKLKTQLEAKKTYAFVGSSGVGKSTLVNSLLGSEDLKTQSLSLEGDKGRHTTSSSSFFELPWGAFILDTPGLRGLEVYADEELLADTLLGEASHACRFTNCTHTHEPGCAVKEAIDNGDLKEDSYENYLKLRRENAFHARKENKALAAQEKKKWKSIAKAMKQKK